MKKRITPDVRKKIYRAMLTDDYREKQRVSKTGERNGMHGVFGANHPQWNPERTHEQRVKERKTSKDRLWRTAVFERDKYPCQSCGYEKGHILVAHHIRSYFKYKELRYDVNNGVTLCEDCHKEYHKIYGWKNSNCETFALFIANRKTA